MTRDQIMTAIPGRAAHGQGCDPYCCYFGTKQVQNIQKAHWWVFAVTKQVFTTQQLQGNLDY